MKYSRRLAAILLSGALALFIAESRTVAAEKPNSLDPVTLMLPSGTVKYLDTGGKGVPLLLLHPVNIRLWQNQIPAFAKAGYRVIAVDSRNHAPGGTGEGFAGNQGQVRLDELVAQLNLPKFHIIGTDMNGGLALQYAMAHPDKIRSVVMSGTLGSLRDPGPVPPHTDLAALESSLRPAPFNELPLSARYLSPSYRAGNPDGAKRWLELEDEGNVGWPQPQLPSGGTPNFSGGPSGELLPNQLTVEKLEAWTLPTMMITGDADNYTPPAMMRIFVSHLKHGNGAGAVIPESAHATYWENPDAYNRTVLKFIRKH
jgi:pimeloyl-ACP methyl ester carboxylesterase